MEGLSISSIWKVLKWLPSFLLKKIFTKQRMAELILVDVRPRHECATVNLGEVATFDLWLQIINLSPFDVELDRAQLRFWCGGTILNAVFLKKLELSSGQISELHISENIPDGHATQISRNIDNHQSAIEIEMEFNCKLHDFAKSTGHLGGVLPRFLNQQSRIHNNSQ
ncbi:MAG: hypothetical protein KZQ91_01210 [Candidatus Thiodiazotropha sp. (ex Lucinoma borealis)]|nr:hypothetical protein [Candidatus Thiodiazotropha sp. (ex Lucinoma borealis)]